MQTDGLPALRRFLMVTTRDMNRQPLPNARDWHNTHMAIGFEMGFLKVIEDEEHFKSTRKRRNIVVYTTPQELAETQLMK